MARAADIYIWPQPQRPRNQQGQYGVLHAKCAVADQNSLFISSANLTGHALALNIELGVLIQGGPLPVTVSTQFQRLIEQGILVPISPSVL